MERNYAFLDTAKRGVYFDKKEYDHKPLPVFEEIRDSLPDPRSGQNLSGMSVTGIR